MKDHEMEGRPKRSLNPLRFFFSKEADEGYVPNRELLSYSAALAGQMQPMGSSTSGSFISARTCCI